MKFEKLNDNKIRIILTHKDLNENHIDYHSILSNSVETQDLFLDVLERAEEEIGFVTKDYKIRIDALAMMDGDFILTVTRMRPEEREKRNSLKEKSSGKYQVKVKRKSQNLQELSHMVYRFSCFDDFYDFAASVSSSSLDLRKLATQIQLYTYENAFYLILHKVNLNHKQIHPFSSYITEFASFVNDSEVYISKIMESGKLLLKHNALSTALKHF